MATETIKLNDSTVGVVKVNSRYGGPTVGTISSYNYDYAKNPQTVIVGKNVNSNINKPTSNFGGKFKDTPNEIDAIYPDGHKEIIFK